MLPFDLPAPQGHSIHPLWDGRNFVFGGMRSPVLEYSENFAGWSDELCMLHDEPTGDSHPIPLASRKDALLQVGKFMPSSKAVMMEIGSSVGFLVRDLVKSFPEATIIGSDVVKAPLYHIAKNFPGIPLIRFDLLQCPLPDQSVDVLIMLNVLEHIEDDTKALQIAFNLLKPGGALIIEVPAFQGLYDAYDEELHHFRRYSPRDLYAKLTKTGFKVARRSCLGFVVFPAFMAVKLFRKWFSAKEHKTVFSCQEDGISRNRLVRWAMTFEFRYLSGFQLPFGIRVLAVAVKKG